MFNDLAKKAFRQEFVEENVKTGIAFQIRSLRERVKWSQAELGRRMGRPQNVISRLENPDYGKFTIRTLLDLASAFDIALLIRFVSFGRLIEELKDVSPAALAVPRYDEEKAELEEHLSLTAASLRAYVPSFSNTPPQRSALEYATPPKEQGATVTLSNLGAMPMIYGGRTKETWQ